LHFVFRQSSLLHSISYFYTGFTFYYTLKAVEIQLLFLLQVTFLFQIN